MGTAGRHMHVSGKPTPPCHATPLEPAEVVAQKGLLGDYQSASLRSRQARVEWPSPNRAKAREVGRLPNPQTAAPAHIGLPAKRINCRSASVRACLRRCPTA